jgi:hypothetical protein
MVGGLARKEFVAVVALWLLLCGCPACLVM